MTETRVYSFLGRLYPEGTSPFGYYPWPSAIETFRKFGETDSELRDRIYNSIQSSGVTRDHDAPLIKPLLNRHDKNARR